jgi:adenosylcobinamide-GDP ribazoletransferase
VHHLLAPHLSRMATAFVVVVYSVCVTGGLHEDGLADVADAFGGGATREKILNILRDSRIGAYGGIALVLSLIGRIILVESIPLRHVSAYLVTAGVLSRWTPLPLSYWLRPARAGTTTPDGQGARIAHLTTTASLTLGTVFTIAVAVVLLRAQAPAPILATTAVTWLTACYYKDRIGGVTGDCFGATIQLTEISVYLCGAFIP